jgi:hypothetical protein
MIERRPFHELPSEELGWLEARRHFSSEAKDEPDIVTITAIEDADLLMVDVL